MKHYFLYVTTVLLFASCDLIDYHPYDTRVNGEKGLTEKNVHKIVEQCAGKDTLRIVHISDTQRWYDETEELVSAINQRGDVDFVIHTGDHSDFGITKEFLWMRDIYQKLSMPYVCIIGNHDCLGTGADVYRSMFGDVNFSFNASFLHVVCLNTNAFEYDYSTAVPDFTFIEEDIKALPDSITQTIVGMHAIPGSEQFNNNVTNYFDYMLNKYPGISFCMSGHDHHSDVHYPFQNEERKGLPFYECASAKNKNYILYTITKDSYSYEIVKL